jgi:hypothetical protein
MTVFEKKKAEKANEKCGTFGSCDNCPVMKNKRAYNLCQNIGFFAMKEEELDSVLECFEESAGTERKSEEQTSTVEHPAHYNQGGIECIDAIRAAVTSLNGFEGFCAGNAIKYIWRYKHKNGAEDLKKADWYLKVLEKEQEGQPCGLKIKWGIF